VGDLSRGLLKNSLMYFLAVLTGAVLVSCCTLLLVLIASGEVALSKWLMLRIGGNCLIATIILLTAHIFCLIGFLLVLVNVTLHHHKRTPVGKILSHLLAAIVRCIDRFFAPAESTPLQN